MVQLHSHDVSVVLFKQLLFLFVRHLAVADETRQHLVVRLLPVFDLVALLRAVVIVQRRHVATPRQALF